MARVSRFLGIALSVALAAAQHGVDAAGVVVRLQPGAPVRAAISGRAVNEYDIVLDEGQYARVSVEHHGIALTLRLVDADGVVQTEIRSEEADGQDELEVASEQPAAYQIRVTARFPNADAGSYVIAMRELRAASERDRLLFEARRRYAESNRLFRSGAYPDAEAAAGRALAIREQVLGPDHIDVAEALNQAGMIAAARNDAARGEALPRRALAINERAFGPDHPRVADTLDILTTSARLRSDFAEGERLGKRAVAIRTGHYGPDHPMVVSSLGALADVYAAKNEQREAERLADQAFDIVARMFGPDDQAYADFAFRASRTKMQLGNFARAEELATMALATTERLGPPDGPQVAFAVASLAGVLFSRGDNVKAEQMFQRGLALYRKTFGNDHLNVGMILNSLGLLAYRRGDDEGAERYYTQALDIRDRLAPNHPLNAAILNNLGLLALRKRDYAKATTYYQRALEINERTYGPDSVNLVPATINLGIIATESGDYERAEAFYQRGLAIEERKLGPNHPQVGVNLVGLGVIYRDTGDYPRAESLFRRALAIAEQSLGVDHPSVAQPLSHLAQVYAAQGDDPRVLPLLERLVAVQEKNLPLNLAAGSERQKLAYFEPFGSTLDRVISLQIRDVADAHVLAATTLLQRKGRILDAMADSLGALRRRSAAADLGLLDELSDVTAQLATLVVNGPQGTPSADYQRRVKVLVEKREALEIDVSRHSSGYYEPSKTMTASTTLAAVREAIPENAALVEFAVYRPFDPGRPAARKGDMIDERYAAFVIRRSGEIGSKDLGLVAEVDEAVAALRLALRDPQRQDANERARALDERVLQPLRDMVGDATRLLISPDGSLNLVPFEALVDERGRHLVERYAISYLTTGRDLLRLRVARESKSEPLVVADPLFGEPPAVDATGSRAPRPSARMARRSVVVADNLSSVYFAPLAGTGVEARTIKSLFPDARLLTGDGATKAALARADAPRILHIATHGFFLNPSGAVDNPLLRSGLALTGANRKHDEAGDGILTALEASNLNLWGTKLVTLSACDTGVGEVRIREGVYGLRRAFFLAGAETLVMSLWPVSDLVTREVMTAYYSGLRRGLGRGDALRQAQLAMLARANRRHPFYWASFIQAGEWANLQGLR